MTEHIFISYARQDGLSFAERLEADLQKAGRRVWRDKRNLDPHQDFTAELEKAIESASHVAVCLTPDTKRDDSFVRREIGYALACQKPIIPLVMVANIIPPIHIVNLTRIDFHQQVWTQAFNELLARLQLSTSQYEAATPPDDPFRDYLNRCYQEIIAYMDTTVFSLIALHAQSAPGQVQPEEIRRSLPVGFTGLSVKPTKTQADEQPRAFDTFAEAFDYYNGRVLLLGEPGAGKTTTLMAFARNAIAQRLSDPTQSLPLLAAISTWDANQQPPLAEWLAAMADLDVEKVHQLLVDGRALLLLDALDELGNERQDPETKDRFDPRLKFISLILTNNRVLISCRIKDYAELGTKTILNGAITLQPLDDAQLAEYLHDHPDLWEAVQTDDGLRDMARTPLLLSLFAFAYQGMGEKARELRNLKHSPGDLRNEIFKQYVQKRYEHEKSKAKPNLPYDLETMYKILGHVAMENIIKWNKEKNIFRAYDFWKLLGDDHHPYAFSDQMCRLNIMVSSDKYHLRFVHLLLRDHFAIEPLITALRDDYYSMEYEGIEFLSQINSKRLVEPLISILKGEYGDNDRAGKAIAIQGLLRIRDAHSVEGLIAALNDTDEWIRARAAEALGKLGDEQAVEPLIYCLNDENYQVRAEVAKALGQIGDKQATLPLISHLYDNDLSIQYHIVESLGYLGDVSALEPLVNALADVNTKLHENLDEAIVETFVKFGEQAVEMLIANLFNPNWHVQWGITQALRKIGDPRAIEPLIVALSQRDDLYLSNLAEEALIGFGDIGLKYLNDTLYSSNYLVQEKVMEILQARSEWEPKAKDILDKWRYDIKLNPFKRIKRLWQLWRS